MYVHTRGIIGPLHDASNVSTPPTMWTKTDGEGAGITLPSLTAVAYSMLINHMRDEKYNLQTCQNKLGETMT